jgi:hypothetical protein
MPVFLWVAIGVTLGVTLVALVVLTLAILRLLRTSGGLGAALEPYLARLAEGSEGLAARSERLAESQLRLQESLAALQASRSQLDTLRWAMEEPLRFLRLLRTVIPAK